MNDLEQALIHLVSVLDRLRIPYMVIGGFANTVWGEPRATIDIDVTVWIAEPEISATIEHLVSVYPARVADPLAFAMQTRVLPLVSPEGVNVDVIFGMLLFEELAIQRAVIRPVAGLPVRFCTPEDLILHKVISDRERDLLDARGITLRRFSTLDVGYLEPRVSELALQLDRPEIRARWEAWKLEASTGRGET